MINIYLPSVHGKMKPVLSLNLSQLPPAIMAKIVSNTYFVKRNRKPMKSSVKMFKVASCAED